MFLIKNNAETAAIFNNLQNLNHLGHKLGLPMINRKSAFIKNNRVLFTKNKGSFSQFQHYFKIWLKFKPIDIQGKFLLSFKRKAGRYFSFSEAPVSKQKMKRKNTLCIHCKHSDRKNAYIFMGDNVEAIHRECIDNFFGIDDLDEYLNNLYMFSQNPTYNYNVDKNLVSFDRFVYSVLFILNHDYLVDVNSDSIYEFILNNSGIFLSDTVVVMQFLDFREKLRFEFCKKNLDRFLLKMASDTFPVVSKENHKELIEVCKEYFQYGSIF